MREDTLSRRCRAGAGFQFMIAGLSHDSGFNSFHLLRVILREYREMALGDGGGEWRNEERNEEKGEIFFINATGTS